MPIQCISPWGQCAKSVVASTTFLAAAALITGIALTVLKGHSTLSVGLISGGGTLFAVSLSYIALAFSQAEKKKNSLPPQLQTMSTLDLYEEPTAKTNFLLRQKEVELIKKLDEEQKNSEWQKHEQALPHLFKDWKTVREGISYSNPDILLIGDLSEENFKIIRIVSEYLSVFFHVSFQFPKDILSLDSIKSKVEISIKKQQNPETALAKLHSKFPRVQKNSTQFNADVILGGITESDYNGSGRDFIAFTNKDLYGDSFSSFVFGLAYFGFGAICSTARFGNDLGVILKRMLTLAVHEFGHVRGLHHCDCGHCCMNGYMNLSELDSSPLIYCSEDTGKHCFQLGVSILEHTKNVLDHLKKLQADLLREDVNLPIQWEITTLEKRIAALSH